MIVVAFLVVAVLVLAFPEKAIAVKDKAVEAVKKVKAKMGF